MNALLSPAAPPAADADPADGLFDFLDDCHRQIAAQLHEMRELADAIEGDGLTATVRIRARALKDWFNAEARQHHLDEEKHVFPALLASGDATVVQHTQRLIQDHGWLEEDWLEIEPSLSAAADGYTWFDPIVLKHAVQVYGMLYLDHMVLEESLAYPEARARLDPAKLKAMGTEMARRRALREAGQATA